MCQGKRHDVFWLFWKDFKWRCQKGKPSAYGEEQITLPNEAETFQEIPGFTMEIPRNPRIYLEIPGNSRIFHGNSLEFQDFL